MLNHSKAETNKKLICDYTEHVFNKHDAGAAVGFMSPESPMSTTRNARLRRRSSPVP